MMVLSRADRSNLMQSVPDHDDMIVTFYCKRPDSDVGEECASFYRTDRGSWIVQGDRRGEQVATQLRALKPDETFLEIPENLVELFVHKYAEERYGVHLDRAATRTL
jgi:hypothetical protein